MRPRDVVLVGALAVLLVFAALDSLRDRSGGGNATRPPTTSSATAGPTEASPAASLPHAVRQGLLLFTDGACSLNEVDLESEPPAVRTRLETNCALWAPAKGDRIAYGVGQLRRDDAAFRVTDLHATELVRGPYRARPGSIVWSPDGRRVGWCDLAGRGHEVEMGGRARRLPACPAAYTATGRPAYLSGRTLVVGGRAVFAAPQPLTFASFGEDGSLAVVFDRQIDVYRRIDDRYPIAGLAGIPPFRGAPLFGPNNCGALLRSPHTGEPPDVVVLALGCSRVRGGRFLRGNEAAWSPDGSWIAVADERGIAFYSVSDPSRNPARLEGRVNQLVWKAG